MSRLAIALVHYPCLDKHGEIYSTSITNLDVHDIARSARTYGIDHYYIVHPVQAQQEMAQAVITFWQSDKARNKNPDRSEALSRVSVVSSIEEATEQEILLTGNTPWKLTTSANLFGNSVSYQETRKKITEQQTTLLCFGTGHGLADEVMQWGDNCLVPLQQHSDYNHLSVRSAAAIIIDRLCSSD